MNYKDTNKNLVGQPHEKRQIQRTRGVY